MQTEVKKEKMKINNKISISLHAILVIICLVPSILAVASVTFDGVYPYYIMALSIGFIAILIAINRFSKRLSTLLLAVFSLIAIAEIWILLDYSSTIDSNYLAILAESNRSESYDFLQMVPFWVIVAFFAVGGVSILALLMRPYQLTKGFAQALFLAGTVTLVVPMLILQNHARKIKDMYKDNTANESIFLLNTTGPDLVLRRSYPTGLLFSTQDFVYQRQELRAAIELHKNYSFGVVKNESSSASIRQVYVLVIGESSSFAHWGINGYDRNTTPLLSQRNDIVSFKDFFTSAATTRMAVPILISRKPYSDVRPVFREASIVSYFKELGFDTSWVSLQAQYGYHDSPISVSAFEAEQVIFLNPHDYRFKGVNDYESLRTIKKLIDTSDKDLFIVLHTLGSHLDFADRYDDSSRHFTPDRRDDGFSFYAPRTKDRTLDLVTHINAYDNSIVATDKLLAGLIELLEGYKAVDSWMLYASDHGQSLHDDCTRKVGHGFPAPNVNQIPVVFWASEGYAKANPSRVKAMRVNESKPTSASMFFFTMVGLSGGYIPTETVVGYDLSQENIVKSDERIDMDVNNYIFSGCEDNKTEQNVEPSATENTQPDFAASSGEVETISSNAIDSTIASAP